MRIDRDRARAAFEAYAGAYNQNEARIQLKVDHTLRVAALCEHIASTPHDEGGADLSGDDIDLAWLIGLLHDIGRFEQVRQFGTFSDAASFNHAEKGAQILFEDGLVRRFVDDAGCDALIQAAVATHGAYRLPPSLDTTTRTYCDILRDADKVDILRVCCTEDVSSVFGADDDALRASTLTLDVVDVFFEDRCVPTPIKRTSADRVAGFCAFVYEIVHPVALRIANEQGYLWQLLSREFDDDETMCQFLRMRRHLENWVAQRLT